MTEYEKKLSEESEWIYRHSRHRLTGRTNADHIESTADEHAEGKDLESRFLIPACSMPQEDETFLLTHPTEEVKAVNGLLRKDSEYNHGDDSGTLPFEIFINWRKDGQFTEYYPYAGWLLSLFNPELYRNIMRDHGRTGEVFTPGVLAFILYDAGKPFASIVFEDIPKLKERIRECLPQEWDLDNWNIPPLSEKHYWSRYIDYSNHGFSASWNPANGGMIQNCWHIPLRKLLDIATVTMLGAYNPTITVEEEIEYQQYRDRLEFINSYAWDKDAHGHWKERRITGEMIQNEIAKANGRTQFKWNEEVYTDIRELRAREQEQGVICTP